MMFCQDNLDRLAAAERARSPTEPSWLEAMTFLPLALYLCTQNLNSVLTAALQASNSPTPFFSSAYLRLHVRPPGSPYSGRPELWVPCQQWEAMQGRTPHIGLPTSSFHSVWAGCDSALIYWKDPLWNRAFGFWVAKYIYIEKNDLCGARKGKERWQAK